MSASDFEELSQMDDTANAVEAETASVDEAAPQHATDEGFPLANGLPVNRRLRLEALADRGADTDPEGIVPDDEIVATRDRLAAERADAEEAPARAARELCAKSLKDLRELAGVEGAALVGNESKADTVKAIEAHRALASEA